MIPKVTFLIRLIASSVCIFSLASYAGHPSMKGMPEEMVHPSQPVPPGALIPSIIASLIPDPMDGFNLTLHISNFKVTVPPKIPTVEKSGKEKYKNSKTQPSYLSGHMHLYINGEKKSRIYGNSYHLPASWLKLGINSVTISVNNHQHGTFTYKDKEIQSTVIIDTREDTDLKLVKSVYSWPGKNDI